MLIDIIAGARPNFMKVAPIIHQILSHQKNDPSLRYRLVHTGQHYDHAMSKAFFDDLKIPKPDINLEVGSGTQAQQTGEIMRRYEELLLQEPCDITVVVGDVNSTMACAIVAKKLDIKVAHVEGGIRSRDLSMPEEINRMVTDSITDYFFTTSETANRNLATEGVSSDRIFFVGNTMVDTLLANMDRLQQPAVWDELKLEAKHYLVMTMHRPANVDQENHLLDILREISETCAPIPVIFPVHPRTAKILAGLGASFSNIHPTAPLGYLEFNYLVKNSMGVITDSGGITEETTMMSIPCITLRDNTERPETCTIGTNELIGTNPEAIKPYLDKLLQGSWKQGGIPEMWDGKTAQRIVENILSLVGTKLPQ